MKIGDEVYFNFEKGKVANTDELGNVSEFETQYGRTSGRNLKCFPVTPHVEETSRFFRFMYDELYATSNNLAFNQVYSYMVRWWIIACVSPEKLKEVKPIVEDFVEQVKIAVNTTIHGITIFKR